ncbi:MAG: rhomboid family intramembrane serine protease [Saprospiraceae bacterium]|nr:rhomboid family intramembrane serine protease [Saprospiraceae bacterium]
MNHKDRLITSVIISGGFCLALILIHLYYNLFTANKFIWSIYPRDFGHWYGMFTGHFIHASWEHLLGNVSPLLVTLVVLFFFYRSISWFVFIMIWFCTGFAVFMFARDSAHLGASGLVYGLISFIFFSGFFRRNIRSVALMIIVTIMYGGYTAGFLPMDERVSWESHLLGAFAGLWAAFVFRDFREHGEEEYIRKRKTEDVPREYFFSRDVFDKTLTQRRKEAEEANSNYLKDDDFTNIA